MSEQITQVPWKERFSLRFFTIMILIWVLDMLTKYWALGALGSGKTISVIGDLLVFRLVYNTGGVFGTFQGNPFIFHVLTGIAIVFLLLYYAKTPDYSTTFSIAISFVLGGALGNFTDRFFRPGVVDFIDMGIGSYRWPTYNLADAFISIGAVLLLFSFAKEAKQAEKVKTNHEKS
ncbi:MAG: signal peptidase II [Candidatus Hydrogenedentota bacterium]|nr:MAG: signal peptidase II [Candidatus Hydrogenedentota bacterium]